MNNFFNSLPRFTPHWDYKPTNAIHADSPGVYTNEKILNLIILDKIHIKSDVIDRGVLNRVRKPILYSFVLDKPPVYKFFCEPETIHFNKINISVLNTITLYLEDDNSQEVNFNGETMTFTPQMIKI